MSEAKFLVDQLRTTFNGDSWHGPNLVKTLEGISLENAKNRYLEGRHTIWELTGHITRRPRAVSSRPSVSSLSPWSIPPF